MPHLVGWTDKYLALTCGRLTMSQTSCQRAKCSFIVAALFDEFALKSSLAELGCFDKGWYHLHCLQYIHFWNTKYISGTQNILNTSSQPVSAMSQLQRKLNNNNNNILLLLLLLTLLTAIGLSPGGSGYFTCTQNMKLVTTEFKSGGLHEKHVVATWNL